MWGIAPLVLQAPHAGTSERNWLPRMLPGSRGRHPGRLVICEDYLLRSATASAATPVRMPPTLPNTAAHASSNWIRPCWLAQFGQKSLVVTFPPSGCCLRVGYLGAVVPFWGNLAANPGF